jgi:hypothetical protein
MSRSGNPVLDFMRRHGMPETREVYLAFAYPGNMPEPWTAEHEMQLPEELRDPDAVGRANAGPAC